MIVAVWGNNGSGKSTLAIKVAMMFAKMDKNVILLDTDFIAPQINVWYPKLDIRPEASLTNVLSNAVTTEIVAEKLTVINDRLGVLGYCKALASNAVVDREDTPNALMTTLEKLCDVVVVDCQSNVLLDLLSFQALRHADERIIAISPDLRGIAWYETNAKMFEEEWVNANSVRRIMNQCTSISPLSSVEAAVGSAEYYLPFVDELGHQMLAGAMDEWGRSSGIKKYNDVVRTLVTDILQKHREV